MGELINGRTAEKIKAQLACCSKERGCHVCPDVADSNCSLKLCADALALIERLEAAVPRWISVEERLPEETNVYLIHAVHRYNKNDGYRCMDVRLFFKGEFEPWQGLPDIYEVTHWMQLPEPPKESA